MFRYDALKKHYMISGAPKGFYGFMKVHGVNRDRVNTCGIRLSYAMFNAEKTFFHGVRARSGVEWYGLPTRASDLAVILTQHVRKPERVRARKGISGRKGIIFFDTIEGFGGTGHISLWDGTRVVDGGDYFGNSPRVYFWELGGVGAE